MRHAIDMLYGALFGRVWRSEVEQGVLWIGFIRGAMIGLIVGTLIEKLA